MKKSKLSIKVLKTLYHNKYRCTVSEESGQVLAHLSVIPQFPLSSDELPKDAPAVPPFLMVLVEDADINQENLIHFEENMSVALLNRFTTEHASPHTCQFFYPSPAFLFCNKNLESQIEKMQ